MIRFFLCFFAFFIFHQLGAATYYVSNNGSDNNNGSQSSPWQTIQHAANEVRAGDSISIEDGIYEESVIIRNSGNNSNGFISFTGNGTVIMQGNSNLNSAFETDDASYINIENIIIQDYHREGIAFYGNNIKRNIRLKNLIIFNSGISRGVWDHGIQIQHVENFIVEECEVYNSQGNNIYVYESGYGAIVNCIANGPEDGDYRDDSDGITIQNSKRVCVKNCVANYNGEDGIDIGGHSGSDVKHIRVINCETNYNKDDGLCFSVSNDSNDFDGYDVTFAKCLSVNNLASGIICYQQPDDVKIVHNTIVGNKWGINIRNENPKNFKIKNNIFSQNINYNFATNDIAANVFDLSYTNWYNQVPLNPYDGSNYQNEDPLFQQQAGANFELSEGSPSIDFGAPLTQTTSAGNGNNIPVEYAKYFCGGFGVIEGDSIQVGSQQVQIVDIDPNQNIITVSENIQWNEGDAVNFLFSGTAPDLGWKEYNQDITTLIGDVNCNNTVDAVDALFILQYTVDLRNAAQVCPLPENSLYLPNADVNDDGTINAVDALFVLQCTVEISNVLCP